MKCAQFVEIGCQGLREWKKGWEPLARGNRMGQHGLD